jgi:hypothetical protein
MVGHQKSRNRFGSKKQGYFNYLHGIMLSQTNINHEILQKKQLN